MNKNFSIEKVLVTFFFLLLFFLIVNFTLNSITLYYGKDVKGEVIKKRMGKKGTKIKFKNKTYNVAITEKNNRKIKNGDFIPLKYWNGRIVSNFFPFWNRLILLLLYLILFTFLIKKVNKQG